MSHHGHHNPHGHGHHNARPLINALHNMRQEMHHPIIPPPHHGHGHHSPHHVTGADVGAALLVGGVLGAGVALAASTQPTTVTTISSPPRPVYVQQQPVTTTTTYVTQQPLQTTYVQPTYVPTIPQQQPYYYQQQPTIQQQQQVYPTVQQQQYQQQQVQQQQYQQQQTYTTSSLQTQPLVTQTTPTTYTTTNVNTVQYQQKSTTFQDNANYYGTQKEGDTSKNIEKEGFVSTTPTTTTTTTTATYNTQFQPLNPFYGSGSTSTSTNTSGLPLSSPSTTNTTSTSTSTSTTSTSALNTQQQINPFYVYGDITKTTTTTTDSTETKVGEVSEKLSKLEVSSKSLVWSQPLEDAKPSLISSKSVYSDQDALEDAKKLRAAMKGFGSDDGVICEITGSRNHKQRLQIKRMFVKVDDKGERNLLKDLESELGGDFRKTVLPLYSEPGSADAKWMKDALDGRGYNSDLLLEILCTRTNEELQQLKEAWAKLEKKTLVDRISDETSKLFSTGHFKTFCTNILEANRPSNGPVDDKAAAADAEHLNRALSQDKKGDAKTAFVTIFTQRSWRHIAAVSAKFQQISQKYTLEAAIKHEWSDSDTSKGLRIILEFVTSPYDYWAKRLHNAMSGLGTDDCTLQRIIISRCEIDLANVAQVFADRYGKGKTLKSWIENDTRGHYEKLLLKLAGY